MYIFFSLLGSSIDGFICGCLLKGLGLSFRKKEFASYFCIISVCCFLSGLAGKIFSYTYLARYIDLLGLILMLFLAYTAFVNAKKDIGKLNKMGDSAMAFSVAADASVVCMYLGLSGANIYLISLISGLMHCVLIYAGSRLSDYLVKPSARKKVSLTSGIMFLVMAMYKLKSLMY